MKNALCWPKFGRMAHFFLIKKNSSRIFPAKDTFHVSAEITMNVRTKTIAMQNSEACFGSLLLCALLCDRLSGLLLGSELS